MDSYGWDRVYMSCTGLVRRALIEGPPSDFGVHPFQAMTQSSFNGKLTCKSANGDEGGQVAAARTYFRPPRSICDSPITPFLTLPLLGRIFLIATREGPSRAPKRMRESGWGGS